MENLKQEVQLEQEARSVIRKQLKLISANHEGLMQKENIREFIQKSIQKNQKALLQLKENLKAFGEKLSEEEKQEIETIRKRYQKLANNIEVYQKALEIYDEVYQEYIAEQEKIHSAEQKAFESARNLSKLVKSMVKSVNEAEHIKRLKEARNARDARLKSMPYGAVSNGNLGKLGNDTKKATFKQEVEFEPMYKGKTEKYPPKRKESDKGEQEGR